MPPWMLRRPGVVHPGGLFPKRTGSVLISADTSAEISQLEAFHGPRKDAGKDSRERTFSDSKEAFESLIRINKRSMRLNRETIRAVQQVLQGMDKIRKMENEFLEKCRAIEDESSTVH